MYMYMYTNVCAHVHNAHVHVCTYTTHNVTYMYTCVHVHKCTTHNVTRTCVHVHIIADRQMYSGYTM